MTYQTHITFSQHLDDKYTGPGDAFIGCSHALKDAWDVAKRRDLVCKGRLGYKETASSIGDCLQHLSLCVCVCVDVLLWVAPMKTGTSHLHPLTSGSGDWIS